MIEKDEWIPYTELDWNDDKFNVFSIDTRDFHAGYRLEEKGHKDYDTLAKYPEFFHTEEEIKILLKRYYDDSGGKRDWRYFALIGVSNWGFKYIRIWRSDKGFIVCNSDNVAFKKYLLDVEIDKEHL